MWEWFLGNGIWILIAAVIGFILFVMLRRWTERIVTKAVPQQFREQLAESRKIVTWIIITIGGVFIALVVTAVVVSTFGINIMPALKAIGGWLLEHGVRILIIVVIGYLIRTLAKAVMPQIIVRSMRPRGKGRRAEEELHKRAQTLSHLFTQTIAAVIVFAAFFMILSELEIDIGPLLAGAGIIGIAIGFGAQHLIKDLVNGMFILAEDQYNVGDVIRIAGIAGLVEQVNLRRTVLRDLDGIMHTIPNGEITTSSNFTKEWSRVNLNIPVAYGEDLDHCINVINRVGTELAKDDVFGPMILTPPKALRVDNFGESGIEIKVLGDTKPLKQWDVMGELRKQIKKAFDQEGIEIPWPHVKLYFGDTALAKTLACAACARLNTPDSKFCSNCGASLKQKEKTET